MEMENSLKSILYMTVNTVNNKIYVGVHITNTPYKFDGYYGDGITGTSCYWFKHPKYPFQRACKKYGLKAFKRYTLMVFDTYEEALEQEKIVVNAEFIRRPDTYNVALGGGSGLVLSTEKPVYQYGLDGNFIKEYRSISDASRRLEIPVSEIICAAQTGGISHGFYWTFKKVMKLNLENFKKPQAKPVYLYNSDFEFVEEMESISQCAKKLEVTNRSVQRAIERHTKCSSFYISFDKTDSFEKPEKIRNKQRSSFYQYGLDGNFIKEVSYDDMKETYGSEFHKIYDVVREQRQFHGFLWSRTKVDSMIVKQHKRQIEQYDLNGNLVKVWDSYRECNKEFSNLRYVLNGARSNTKGFYFKYKIE